MRTGWLFVLVLSAAALAWFALPRRPNPASSAVPAETEVAEPATGLIGQTTFDEQREALGVAPIGAESPAAVDTQTDADSVMTITGRVLDEHGTPEPGLELRLFPNAPQEQADTCATDSDGRFAVQVLASAWKDSQDLFVFQGKLWNEATGRNEGRSAIVKLHGPILDPHDVGDFTLVRYPILVSGSLRGTDGEPLRANVMLNQEMLVPGEPTWFRAEELRTRSDENGWFEVRGIAFSRLTLHVSPDLIALPVQTFGPFATGSQDLSLVVQPPANRRITTRVLLDDGFPLEAIAAWLERPDGTCTDSIRLGPRGFTFRTHAAGEYDLVVCTAESRLVVLEIKDLDLPAGVECTDPRLAEIDLRGRLARIRMHVRRGTGEPAAGAGFSITHSNETLEPVVLDSSGNAAILVPRDVTELVVHPLGGQPVAIRDGDTLSYEDLKTRYPIPE